METNNSGYNHDYIKNELYRYLDDTVVGKSVLKEHSVSSDRLNSDKDWRLVDVAVISGNSNQEDIAFEVKCRLKWLDTLEFPARAYDNLSSDMEQIDDYKAAGFQPYVVVPKEVWESYDSTIRKMYRGKSYGVILYFEDSDKKFERIQDEY